MSKVIPFHNIRGTALVKAYKSTPLQSIHLLQKFLRSHCYLEF
ncbi:hypothetical protein [Nostoc sphaeroides]|nr:hypothetical protein [Nostoc sphaeroides]